MAESCLPRFIHSDEVFCFKTVLPAVIWFY